MAAVEVPWLEPMSASTRDPNGALSAPPDGTNDPPTYASFSPANLGQPGLAVQRPTIFVQQKSLLATTPPQIIQTLAYSSTFIEPLNWLFGLLSWTSGDPWESFLLLSAFWAVTLYGGLIIRWAGPVVLVTLLIFGMYTRRFSSLSSTSWTGEKAQGGHKRGASDAGSRHLKSLDEIVVELNLFTSRCNILMDPALRLTDYLSTQRTATSATTRPALTALFLRILLVLPIWVILTLPPLYIITARRVVLTIGTVALSWHSRPARVSRTIIWRSRMVRILCSVITGLDLRSAQGDGKTPLFGLRYGRKTANDIAAAMVAKRGPASLEVRFTFTLYENQRRWLGIGWTSSMLAYERAAWTDEDLNLSPSKDSFVLPEMKDGRKWRWVEGSEWHIEGLEDGVDGDNANDDDKGWIYYDSKWRNGRRDKDGWGRYTRRRKWSRDAELVGVTTPDEVSSSTNTAPKTGEAPDGDTAAETPPPAYAEQAPDDAASSVGKRRRWYRRSSGGASMASGTASVNSAGQGSGSSRSERRRDDAEDDVHSPLHHRERDGGMDFGDEARMNLG